MTNKPFTWSWLNLFALLLLIIGIGLAAVTLITSFGSAVSVDTVVTAAVLLLAGVVFLHPAPLAILAPVIALVSLGAGYASYYSTPHSWLVAILATIITAAIAGYGFSLRKTIRQRHSQWYR